MSKAADMARQYMGYIYRRDFNESGTLKWYYFDSLAKEVQAAAYSESIGKEFEKEVING